MTTKQLSQLYYLNKEIARDEERLEELRSIAESITQNVSVAGGRSGKLSDKTAIGGEIVDLERTIREKRRRCLTELKRITDFVDGIDDSMIRQIILLRHAELKSWKQVAMEIGGGNTPDGVRMMYTRYMNGREE